MESLYIVRGTGWTGVGASLFDAYKRSADSWQDRHKKAQAYLHSVRVQSLRMHVIHMLFVTIIAAGLIANERRSVVFSQKSA